MTNAWIQRCITLGTLLFWWGLALLMMRSHPLLAICLAIVPALITPILMAIQCLLSALWGRSAATPAASPAMWLRAWAGEVWAAWRVFCWWQPFCHNRIADQPISQAPIDHQLVCQRGIVLVHGYFCNRALWTVWMQKLKAKGVAFLALDLEPAFGSIDSYCARIEAAVVHMTQTTGLPPLLVGHSMGGLALRRWAATVGANQRVHKIITIGTPHCGTLLAGFATSTNGRQMQIESPWLQNLEKLENTRNRDLFVCFYSNCDNIVYPIESACMAGADNRMVAGYGHVDLLFSASVQAACLNNLR